MTSPSTYVQGVSSLEGAKHPLSAVSRFVESDAHVDAKVEKDLKQWTRKLIPKEAPALFESVERLSKKSKLPMPDIYIVDIQQALKGGMSLNDLMEVIGMEHNCFVAGAANPRLVVGPKLMEMMTECDKGTKMTPEYEAILAHEFGHLKHDMGRFSMKNMGRYAPILGPLAAMTALAGYKFLKQSPDYEQEFRSTWQHMHHENGDQLPAQLPDVRRVEAKNSHQMLKDASHYAMAGLLGLAVGGTAFGSINRFCEFRADKVSAELMGSGTPLADAFRKLQQFAEKQLAAEEKSLKAQGVTDEQIAAMREQQATVGRFTHPPTTERIAELEKMR